MVAVTARRRPVNASTVTHVEYKALFLIQSGIFLYVHTGTTLWLVRVADLVDGSDNEDVDDGGGGGDEDDDDFDSLRRKTRCCRIGKPLVLFITALQQVNEMEQ